MTGILLSILNSLKVLIGKNELKAYRGVGMKCTLIINRVYLYKQLVSLSFDYLAYSYLLEYLDNLPYPRLAFRLL
jgi:hypothetical protein